MEIKRTGEFYGEIRHTRHSPRASSHEQHPQDRVEPGSTAPGTAKRMLFKSLSSQEIGELMNASTEAVSLWECKDPSLESTKFPALFAAQDGALFARSGDSLSRLDAAAGKVVWTASLASPLVSSADALWKGKDDKVLALCQDNQVRSLDPGSGKEEWSFPLGMALKSPISVNDDGTISVFRKKGNNLHFTRLNPDGSISRTTKLGIWCPPCGTVPFQGHFLSREKDGDRIIHAYVHEKTEPNGYRPTSYNTSRISPEGKVKWSVNTTVEPPVTIPGDPDHFYTLEFGSLDKYDKATGTRIWKLEQKYARTNPDAGEKLYELGGEKKYKYLKLVAASQDRLILQGYCEGPLRKTKSGEEIVCVDAANPEKVFWKRDSGGSIFEGPLYADEHIIIHQKDIPPSPIEALDTITGASLWECTIPGQSPGGGIKIFDKDSRELQSKRTAEGAIILRDRGTINALDERNGTIRHTFTTGNSTTGMCLDDKDDTLYTSATDPQDGSTAVRAYAISDASILEEAKRRIEKSKEKGIPDEKVIEIDDDRISIDGIWLRRQADTSPADS
jgi:outer membrane protein assembly factor BamB